MTKVYCNKCGKFIGMADSKAMLKCRQHGWQVIKIDNGVVVSLPFTQTRVSQSA